MRIDFSKYKKLAQDQKTTTLESPKGHKVKIAHDALRRDVREKLFELPMYMQAGGEMEEQEPELSPEELRGNLENTGEMVDRMGNPLQRESYNQMMEQLDQQEQGAAGKEQDNYRTEEMQNEQMDSPRGPASMQDVVSGGNSINDKLNAALGNMAYAMPGMADSSAAQAAPRVMERKALANKVPPPPQMASSQAPAPAIPQQSVQSQNAGIGVPDYGAMLKGYNKAIGKQEKGMGLEAKAEGDLGTQQVNAEMNNQKLLGTIAQNFAPQKQFLMNQMGKIMNEVSEGQINPNHYFESMDTGQRIRTAIGLALSTLGSGLTGQNPGMDFLNKQIDRDIQAQKDSLGVKNTVLSAFQHQFGNLKDAENMAYAVQNNIYASKMREAAAKAKSPLAQATFLKEAGKLEYNSMDRMEGLSLKQAALKTLQGADPAQRIQIHKVIGTMSEKDTEEASKELGEYQKAKSVEKMATDAWDKLHQMKLAGKVFDPAARDALVNPIAGILQKTFEGRYNEDAAKNFRDLFPTWGDRKTTRETKRELIPQFFKGIISNPTLDRYKINPEATRYIPPVTKSGGPVGNYKTVNGIRVYPRK